MKASDTRHRFFEGGWLHKYQGKYYFSYSTGDTHLLVYAEGTSPTGPFTYKGLVMEPVQGWTTHHSIIEVKSKWYIFYHDTQLSGKNLAAQRESGRAETPARWQHHPPQGRGPDLKKLG